MNNTRAPFNSIAARKAVDWAIDRPAMVRLLGKYGGKRSDQILVPGVPGFKPYNLYAFAGPTRQGEGGRSDLAGKLRRSSTRRAAQPSNISQVAAFNL